MASIIIIDDDFAIESLSDALRHVGHDVRRITSAADAMKDIDTVIQADLVVLDILMERPADIDEVAARGGHSTGLIIARHIRQRNPSIPILVLSATQDQQVIQTLKQDRNLLFLSKWEAPKLDDVLSKINSLLGEKSRRPLPTPFIVHGHDEKAKLELKNYLQNVLKLPQPIILHEQPNQGKTLIEKFEAYASESHIVFVLLTPDDQMSDASASETQKRRARQNVIFEMGFFLGMFGRSSGRVILLHKGQVDLPSDISGLTYIDISGGIESAGEDIRKELEHVLK
jgi:predicted nucleotide-binding protein